MTKIPIN